MKKIPFILLALTFAFSNCKKETTPTAPAPCSIVYSAWSCCSNNLLTRTYSLSSTNCTDIPPLDSLQRDCVMPKEVTIGSQVWTATNLDVSTYRNGDSIPQVQSQYYWGNLTTGAWCYYENKTANGTTYGKLYNWFAVNDPRGLAPNGYHIPTGPEWDILRAYLGGWDAGKKIKSTTGWRKGMTLGNQPYYLDGNGSNSSCFAALPGGYRWSNGDYPDTNFHQDAIGNGTTWWTSTPYYSLQDLHALAILISYSGSEIAGAYEPKLNGCYVRCIKD